MNEAQLHPTVGTMLMNAALTEGRITHKRIPSKPRDRQDRNRAQGCIQAPKLDRKSGSQESGYLRGRWGGAGTMMGALTHSRGFWTWLVVICGCLL